MVIYTRIPKVNERSFWLTRWISEGYRINGILPESNIKTADWASVKEKGRRLVSSGRVHVIQKSKYKILAVVTGDTGTYDVYVSDRTRVNKYENNEPSFWDCTCQWGNWSFARETFTGRICSHAYAAYLVLQQYRKESSMNFLSRVEAAVDTDKFRKVVVKKARIKKSNKTARRVFTEEEKLALIDEPGICRQFEEGEII